MKHALFLPSFLVLILSLAACLGPQAPAPATHYGVSQGAGSTGVHTVSRQETLWSISRRYNIVMRDIIVENNLHAPFVLHVGQRLNLPPPREYKVRQGDTLYAVSRLFGTSISELASLNHLSPPYRIMAGQTLRLPSLTRRAAESSGTVAKPESQRSATGRPSQKSASQRRPSRKPEPRTKITAKTPKRSSNKFLTPVQGRLVSGYGPKKDGLHNDGINIQAPKGTPVRAAENGIVVYAGNELKGSGNLILIRHEGRWMTAYAHMDRRISKRGDIVKRGQTIGTVGSTGSVSVPQLHFEVRRGTEALNPERYLE